MPKISMEQMDQIQEYVNSLPENQRASKMMEIMKQFEDEPVQCPFCLMSDGKIKTTKVYEDSKYLGVLEINPSNPGHVLLFPRRHIKSFSDFHNDRPLKNR